MTTLYLGLALSNAPIISAPFTVVATDGWQVTDTTPTDLSLTEFQVRRQGYTTAGVATQWNETLKVTKRVRQAYPNQTSFTADQVALNDYIYSTDTIVGVLNGSLETSPKPIANWTMMRRTTVGDSLPWEVIAFHKDARNYGSGGVGQQVACVRVRATDGTNYTAWQTVSSTTLSTSCEWDNAPEVFAGTLDVSGLNNPALIWLEGEVYPWIGGAASVLKSEDNNTAGTGKRTFTRRHYRRDTARAATFWRVYVASTGNDTTGVASQTDATAAASPCLTVGGALAKLRTAAGATTRGSMDNAHIYIVDTVNMGTPAFQTYYPQDLGGVIITRASGTARASAIANLSSNFRPYFSDHTTGIDEGALIFEDVSFNVGGAFNFTGEASFKLFTQFRNCNIDCNSQTVTLRSNSHFQFFGCNFTDYASGGGPLGQTNSSGDNRGILGCTVDLADASPDSYLIVGSNITRMGTIAFFDASENGHINYNNKVYDRKPDAVPFDYRGSVVGGNLGSYALAQNFVETLRTLGGNGSISLSADSRSGNLTHVVCIHNNTPGDGGRARHNIAYDETVGTARTHKFVCYKGNLGDQLNSKADIFISDGARRGNAPFDHGVACEGNYTKDLNASGGALSFGVLYAGIGTQIAAGSPLYVDNRAVNNTGPVAGSSGGDYKLQAGSGARDILSIPLLKYDIDGTSRGTGTQDAGCYA